MLNLLWASAAAFFRGVCDVLSLHRVLLLVLKSGKESAVVRQRIVQCFVLNGVIFVGSIVLYRHAIVPVFKFIFTWTSIQDLASRFIEAALTFLYHTLWVYPIYCVSFILNTVWYQDIADRACAVAKMQDAKMKQPPYWRMVHELYRMFNCLVYLVLMYILLLLPVVGRPLYFLHFSWIVSLYSFEYRWSYLQWDALKRRSYFNERSIYFAGFGFPLAVIYLLCPRLIDSGVFALTFPFCILAAVAASPVENPVTFRVGLFTLVERVNLAVLTTAGSRVDKLHKA
jgi:etoposide-induced 2.4 mRNA